MLLFLRNEALTSNIDTYHLLKPTQKWMIQKDFVKKTTRNNCNSHIVSFRVHDTIAIQIAISHLVDL